MKPVKFAAANFVYRGPTPEIGDLWVHRVEPGLVESVWEPSDDERQMIADGGRVVLAIHGEPMPPVSVEAAPAELTVPVGTHPFRVVE